MRPLDLIPARWLEYEPPSTCHWPAVGAIATVAGAGLSAMSAINESKYQSAVARNQALIDQQKANEDAALGERAAITQQRKTELAASTLRARAAASGTDAASPDIVNTEQDLAQQGGYNTLSALYEGVVRSRGDQYQADLDLFKSQRAAAAGPLNAAGALIGGVANVAGRLATRRTLLDLYGNG